MMIRTLLIGLALALAAALSAHADSRVSMDDLRFSTPRRNDFRKGEQNLERQPVKWESDAAWLVIIEAVDAELGISDDGKYYKPLSDLQFRLSQNNTWIELRQQAQEFARGERGKGTFTVDWRVLLDITKDRPGRYRAELRLTITEL